MNLRSLCLLSLVCSMWGCDSGWEPLEAHPPSARTAPKRARNPAPIEPREDGNLLESYADRQPASELEASTWELITQAKRVAVALLIIAAHDRLEDLPLVLTEDARWGYPDPRQFNATPIFADDGGEAFLAGLRIAAARQPARADWKTQQAAPGVTPFVRSGAEPMWIRVGTEADSIMFRERVVDGVARIDYVGFFVEPPGPLHVHGAPGMPAWVSPPRRLRPTPPADEAALDRLDED